MALSLRKEMLKVSNIKSTVDSRIEHDLIFNIGKTNQKLVSKQQHSAETILIKNLKLEEVDELFSSFKCVLCSNDLGLN